MNELVAYKSNLRNLKFLLGLGNLHIIEREELLPYSSRVLEVLNTWITLEGKKSHRENVKLFVGYYEDGLNKLIGRMSKLLEDYRYPGESDFTQRYFVAAWANIYSTIYLELLYNYPELFTTSPIDCHECCGSVSKDENGNPIYNSGQGNLSASFIGCGCGKDIPGTTEPSGPNDWSDRIEEEEIDALL